PVLFVVFLLLADWGVGRYAAVWDRYSPDDYTARVNGCHSRERDTVFVGGSPVAEGIDPDRIPGTNYALGLSGGTTSDFYHAVLRACDTPPKTLVYGMTATDINDARGEPHGPASLMTWGEVREWRRLRPENAEWVTRHYLRAQFRRASNVFHYQHGIRMWAATQAGELSPALHKEAVELRDYADALRDGNGYAPMAGFAARRYDHAKAAGVREQPLPFFNKFRTGSHLKYLHKLIDWCDERGVKLVVVDMPVTTDVETRFEREYAEYRGRLQEMQQVRGLRVLWACDALNLPDAQFADVMHLNRDGARSLSDWLRDRLPDGTAPPRVARELPATAAPIETNPAAAPDADGRRPTPGGTPAGGSKLIFASKAFFIFLPVVLLLYHSLRSRSHKYNMLLAASWLFYAWLSPQYLWVILLCTAIDYAAAVRIEDAAAPRARRRWLAASVAANLGLLFAFKYAAFAYDNAVSLAAVAGVDAPARAWDVLLPLGISFHTFQGIAYTVDVFRGRVRAVRSPLDYA
ncbi:MAG TPA: hypothetical protein VM529_14820, partial [Gemmata sp.]|nr:hypothetical protein [Gemmata sp.]